VSLPFDRARGLSLLRDLLAIRRLEEKTVELYSAGKIRGFLHLYIGEEAVAVGVIRSLASDDAVVGTYREHGHALIRGVTVNAIMAEMFGKATGCSRGRGGSMHLFDAARRFYGGNAIVGGGLPLAVGLALADQRLNRQRVTSCFFGDGAAAEGVFQESLNLAALWRVPVLFCCENNYYAMGTALARAHAQTDLCAKARAHGVPAEPVDGMDLVAVLEAAERAVARIRGGGGPQFLELKTYRFRAHSMFDPELYRSRAEVEEWKRRDPIPAFLTRLTQAGLAGPDDVARLEGEIAAELEAAVRFAEDSPWEPVADLLKDVVTVEGR
jgi:pyruvate dehydrogenase E1 component alpha subunit